MSKPARIMLGIATLWPLVYLIIFVGYWFYLVLWLASNSQGAEKAPSGMVAIFLMHGLTILWIMTLVGIYLYHVFNSDKVDKDKKVLWMVVLVLGNAVAMPIYWYLYIWPQNEPAPKTGEKL